MASLPTEFADLEAVTTEDVERAHRRLAGIVNQTPVCTSRTVNQRTGAEVFFKCENFQRTGAFKFRGAYNAIAQLSPAQRAAGVLTYSSGNHAQAIALAGALLGVHTAIIMPQDAPEVKRQATASYGAEIILYDRAERSREALAHELNAARGATLIPPYDHPHVIAGQGTAACALFEEVGALDVLVVCCGGGGFLSGSALAAKARPENVHVVGVEPEAGDDATRSFYSGTLQSVENPDTIADGARTPYLGRYTFPLVCHHVDQMVTVSDDALIRTMYFMWQRMKLVVEPTGVLAAAAVLEGKVAVQGARVGVLISGGNVDLQYAAHLFTRLGK